MASRGRRIGHAFSHQWRAKCSSIKNAEETDIRTLPPLVGLVGSVAFFVMLLYFLFTRLPHMFFLVVIAVVVFSVEAAYFK